MKLPWVGDLAYLHVIYKPAEADIVKGASNQVEFPASLKDFYASCNGAFLFVRAIQIYGCVAPGTLPDRSDPLSLPPFDVVQMNRELDPSKPRGQICIGSYGFDRSLVCLDKQSQKISCYRRENFDVRRRTWPTLDNWIEDEVQRLSLLFSPEGRRLVPEELCLPDSGEAKLI